MARLTAITKSALTAQVHAILTKAAGFGAWVLKAGDFDESKVHRDHGRFASVAGDAAKATEDAAKADQKAAEAGPRVKTRAVNVAVAQHKLAAEQHKLAAQAAVEAGLADHVIAHEQAASAHEMAIADHEVARGAASALPLPMPKVDPGRAYDPVQPRALGGVIPAPRMPPQPAPPPVDPEQAAKLAHAERSIAQAIALADKASVASANAQAGTESRLHAIARNQNNTASLAHGNAAEALRAAGDHARAEAHEARARELSEAASAHRATMLRLYEAESQRVQAATLADARVHGEHATAASEAAAAASRNAYNEANARAHYVAAEAHEKAALLHSRAHDRYRDAGDMQTAMMHAGEVETHGQNAARHKGESSAMESIARARLSMRRNFPDAAVYNRIESTEPRPHIEAAYEAQRRANDALRSVAGSTDKAAIQAAREKAAKHLDVAAQHAKDCAEAAEAKGDKYMQRRGTNDARSLAKDARKWRSLNDADKAKDTAAARSSTDALRPAKIGDHILKVEGTRKQIEQTERILATVQKDHPEVHEVLQRYPVPKLTFKPMERWGGYLQSARSNASGGRVTMKMQLSSTLDLRRWMSDGSGGGAAFRPGVSHNAGVFHDEETLRTSVFIHELGHHIQNVAGVNRILEDAQSERRARSRETGRPQGTISEYAKKDSDEYFAESFLAYHQQRDVLLQQDPIGHDMIAKVMQHLRSS